ncbi:MAG: HD-GYP domain-containing protein [Eubacteriales bacterium]
MKYVMKKHSVIGSDIVNSFEHLQEHAVLVKHHHERVGGRGYPDKIKGDGIPLGARILAVADTYDALTSTDLTGGAF